MCIRKNGHHPTPFCGSLGCPSTKEGDSHNHVVRAGEFNLTIHFKSLRGLAMLSQCLQACFGHLSLPEVPDWSPELLLEVFWAAACGVLEDLCSRIF